MAKGNCEFTGTGGQYFPTVFIHLILLSTITFGIYAPWAWVRLLKLKASHTTINGKSVTFTGTGGQLLVLVIVQGLITLITFGIYGSWAICSFFRWRAENTLVGERPTQFNGTGASLFLFYLIHLMILPMLTLGLYYFWGIYRLYAWKEEHTEYGGKHTSFGAGFGEFVKISFFSWILNFITLNLFTPWSLCMFFKWQVKGLAVGEEHSVQHFPPVRTNPAVVAVLIVIGLLPVLGAGLFVKSQYDKFAGNATQLAAMMKMQAPVPQGGHKLKVNFRKTVSGNALTPLSKAPEITLKQNPQDRDLEVKTLDNMIKLDSNNPDAFYNRAWVYASKGNLQQAENDYTQSIELKGRNRDAFFNRGLVYVKMKKYGLAVQDFTAALRLDPGFPDAYCNRGNAHQKLGENDLALQDYNAALKLQPNDGDLYYNRGVVLLSMGQQAKALEDLKRAAEMGEPNAKRYMKLAGAGTTNAQKSMSPKVEADIFKLIFKGDTAKVKQLLAANPELVHIKGKDGDTPLHQSAFWGRLEIAKELVNRGAQINQPGRLDNTPLHNAAFMGKTELVRLLLAQGADLKAKGNVGGTPLHSAAGGREDQRKLEIVRILIEEGADLDARDKMGGTPVHAAAFSDNPQIAELLIKSGAQVNLKDNSGKTPLAKAELFKRHKAAGILKKNGATL